MNFLPCTAVLFVNNGILSGFGNEIWFYDINDNSLYQKLSKVKTIHGICESNEIILAFGGRFIEFCELNDNKFTKLNQFIEQNEYILDVLILEITSTYLYFCLCLSHGTVIYYKLNLDTKEYYVIRKSETVEKTLLYSCRLFELKNSSKEFHIYAVGGTAQNCIGIWKHSCNENTALTDSLIRKNCHRGAIFGCDISIERNLMVTVGDDRRILLWHKSNEEEWNLMLDLYGHTARVWGARLILLSHKPDMFIISWGEDCYVNLWCLDKNYKQAKLLKRTLMHRGRGIWSADIKINNEKEILSLISGGNDGGLVLQQWLLKNNTDLIKSSIESTKTYNINKNFPRNLILLNANTCLIISDNGQIFLTNQNEDTLEPIEIDGDFNSNIIQGYSTLYCDLSNNLLYIGTINGIVYIIKIINNKLEKIANINLYNKIMGIYKGPNIDNKPSIFICTANGESVLLSNMKKIICRIKNKNNNYFTCVTGWLNYQIINIITGDRNGWLMKYQMNLEDEYDGDNFISQLRVSKSGGITDLCVCSCGLSGVYVGTKCGEVYCFNKEGHLNLILRDSCILGWIGRLELDYNDLPCCLNDGTLIICGFKSSAFRRVTMQLQSYRVLETKDVESRKCNYPVIEWESKCGGGHRSWDLINVRNSDNNTTTFTYIYQRTIKLESITTKLEDTINEPKYIKPYLHGRVINSCLSLKSENSSLLFINVSEDTLVSFVSYSLLSQKHEESIIRQGHISSVRCLSLHSMNLTRHYLITAGGRGQLLLWQLNNENTFNSCILGDVLLSKLTGSNNDIRIMDVKSKCYLIGGTEVHLIMVITSGGNLILLSAKRNSLYNNSSDKRIKFHLLLNEKISNSCLTNCIHANIKTTKTNIEDSISLFMCSTNGALYCFNFDVLICNNELIIDNYSNYYYYIDKVSLHSIDLYTRSVNIDDILIGGDDGGVHVITYNRDDSMVTTKHQHLLAHAGSTVCVKWLCNYEAISYIVSLGSDGYLLFWNFCSNSGLELMRIISSDIGVADPQNMSIYHNNDNNYWFYFVGIGSKLCLYNI